MQQNDKTGKVIPISSARGEITQPRNHYLAELTPAEAPELLEAVAHVALAVGIDIAPERRAYMATALAEQGMSQAELRAVVRGLVASPELDDKIRYGRTLTVADFVRMRGDLEGPAATARLLTWHEALRAWQRAGSPGAFPGDTYQQVTTPEGIRFRPLQALGRRAQ